jgi:hypothetical protein
MTRIHRLISFATLLPAVVPLLAGVLAAGSTSVASAGEKRTKVERQIGIMESIIDDMLVESPNFLVGGQHETRGFEMEDYGAVFMFDASLTGVWWDEDSDGSYFNFWPFGGRKNHVIVMKDGDKKQKEVLFNGGRIVIRDGDVYIEGDDGDLKKLSEKDDWEVMSRQEMREAQAKKYERAKQELIDVLLDAGDVLKALPAGQTVKIVADFHDMDVPDEKEVNKLTVTAKVDDLRAYSDGKLSEDQARGRITVKES